MKIIFFCYHNFIKQSHSKMSKNNPENIPQTKYDNLVKGFKRLKIDRIFDKFLIESDN